MNKKIITLVLTILVAIAAVSAEERYPFDTGYLYKYGVQYRVFTDNKLNKSEVIFMIDSAKSFIFIFRENTAEDDAKKIADAGYDVFATFCKGLVTSFNNEVQDKKATMRAYIHDDGSLCYVFMEQ